MNGSAVYLIPRIGVDLAKYIENEFKPWYDPEGIHSVDEIFRRDQYKMLIYRVDVLEDMYLEEHFFTEMFDMCVFYDAIDCFRACMDRRENNEYDDLILDTVQMNDCPRILEYIIEYEGGDDIVIELKHALLDYSSIDDLHYDSMFRIVLDYMSNEDVESIMYHQIYSFVEARRNMVLQKASALGLYIDPLVLSELVVSQSHQSCYRIHYAKNLWKILVSINYPDFEALKTSIACKIEMRYGELLEDNKMTAHIKRILENFEEILDFMQQ